MRLCNETITVFNAKLDADSGMDRYHPTVISGVSWYCETASTVDASGLKAADKFTIRIPEDADFSGKRYAPPSAYATGDPAAVFTLKNGDVIVKGAVDREGLTPSALLNLCGEVVTILSVTDNRRAPRSRHWRVVGK